jgi:hypothetical protein
MTPQRLCSSPDLDHILDTQSRFLVLLSCNKLPLDKHTNMVAIIQSLDLNYNFP